MKACIYGAGAIGGWIGAALARAGVPLHVVARGATLGALRHEGLSLVRGAGEGGTRERFAVHATDDPAELGVQDLVVIAVKAPALAGVAARIAPLLGDDTIVLTAMNGEHFAMTVESAIQWVKERCILVDAVEAPSLHHNVIAHGKNRFTVSAKKGGDNLLHFQNIAMLIDALDGEYLKEESRDDASSGIPNSITYVLL